jgi:hypothetical protein
MKRIVVLLVLAATTCTSTALLAQAPAADSAPAACPSQATLDELIKALDEAVSGPANKDRTCFRALFVPDARLAPIGKLPDGTFAPHVLTVDGWIDAVAKRGASVLKEHQVKVKTETWGHLAHLWSTYELNVDPAGSPTIRGINSIQALYDGKQWKVLEILWQAESADEKVPEKYLP